MKKLGILCLILLLLVSVPMVLAYQNDNYEASNGDGEVKIYPQTVLVTGKTIEDHVYTL